MADTDSTVREKKRAYLKAWNLKNRERIKIQRANYHRQYRINNSESIKAKRDASDKEKKKQYHAAYYKANKERMNEQASARYRANPDSYKKRAAKWERDNIERKRELRAKYREKYRDKIKEISREDWRKHNAKRKAAKTVYRKNHPELGAHYCRLRQTRKKRATPAWANLEAIKRIYAEASRLKKETSKAWHVDHEVPLKHPRVCGLHVEFNLRVIPGAENQSKGNGFAI